MNLQKTLQNFGLNDKEAKIYLACLELGSASAPKLSEAAELPKSTTYGILDKLKQKGLVTLFHKKRIRHFTAEDPTRAIETAKDKVDLLEQVSSQLRGMWGQAKNRPAVRFYQGKEGMVSILKDVLSEAKEMLSFSSPGDLFATLDDYFPQFVRERTKRKILVKAILLDSPKARERKKLGPSELREVRIFPAQYQHNAIVFMWGDKIAMFSLKKELVALVVESKELSQAFRAMFGFMWDSLGE